MEASKARVLGAVGGGVPFTNSWTDEFANCREYHQHDDTPVCDVANPE